MQKHTEPLALETLRFTIVNTPEGFHIESQPLPDWDTGDVANELICALVDHVFHPKQTPDGTVVMGAECKTRTAALRNASLWQNRFKKMAEGRDPAYSHAAV